MMSAGLAPTAAAIDSLNLLCLSTVNSLLASGNNRASLTKCAAAAATGAAVLLVQATAPLSDTLPAGHSVHVDEPSLPPNLPAGHVMHSDSATAPAAAPYLPIRQVVHVAAPGASLNFPASHCKQGPSPVADLYLPATHAVHVPPSGPDEPALQVQLVKAALPAGEFEFDGQGLHVELDNEYLPAEHAMQSDRASLLSVSRYLPDGQLRQVVTDDEPLMNENLPAAHAIQSDKASLLSVSRYFPG